MRSIHRIGTAAVALLGLLAARPATAEVGVGDKPTLHMKAFGGGGNIDLKDFKGKIVVIDFWATWCGPCMHEAEHMVKVNEEYGPKGMQFIGVSLDDNPTALKKVIGEKNFSWPMIYEGKGWEGATPKAWGVNSIPQTFIIGPDGAVLWRGHPGAIDQPLEKAFKDHPPTPLSADQMTTIKNNLDQAEAAVKADAPAKALKVLASLPTGAAADQTLADRIQSIKDKLGEKGDAKITAAKAAFDAGKYDDATKIYRDTATNYAGLPAGTEAKTKLATMAVDRKAAALMNTAAALKTAGKKDEARAKYDQVTKQFANTEWFQKALDAIGDLDK